jgi:hypothetical protein
VSSSPSNSTASAVSGRVASIVICILQTISAFRVDSWIVFSQATRTDPTTG